MPAVALPGLDVAAPGEDEGGSNAAAHQSLCLIIVFFSFLPGVASGETGKRVKIPLGPAQRQNCLMATWWR